MNIVLISNFAVPSIAEAIGIDVSPKEGWVAGLIDELKKQNHKLYYVFPQRKEAGIVTGNLGQLNYYGFPRKAKKDWTEEKVHESLLTEIFKKIENIDVIHIMGTEYGHTLSAVKAAEKIGLLNKVVISIQGMPSVYSKHVFADLPYSVVFSFSIRDIIRRDNIFLSKRNLELRGRTEVDAIKKVKHVIGRTDWDRACTYEINPTANYHFCNETLRRNFYTGQWQIDKCERHSIFVSQGYNSIKGLHYMLEALSIVKRFYPDTLLYITGKSPLNSSYLQRQKRDSYTNYIEKMIYKFGLEETIHFLGTLNAEEMKAQYLNANVFVSPSSIENSPNSVGEAMLLGTPVVTSDVGGVKDLLSHGKEGFIYQHNAPYMLAYYIMRLFKEDELAVDFSSNSRLHALKTHDPTINVLQLLKIYNVISEG